MNDIDLPPSQYRVKPREGIFGPGALPFLGEIIGTVCVLGLLILIAFMGTQFKTMLFGEDRKQQSQPLPPGNYKWSPEKGVERVN